MIPTQKQTVQCPEISKSILIWLGDPKVGKSTVLGSRDDLLLLDCDNNGAQFVDCYRVPVFSWKDLQTAMKELSEKKGQHPFKIIGLDTVNGAWQLCRRHVLDELKLVHESDDKSFGKSWDIVKTTFCRFLGYAQSLGFGIWMTSHTIQKEVKIQGVKRVVTTIALSDSVTNMILGLADHIFYINTNEDGTRTCYTTPQDSLETGGRLNRFGINKDITFKSEKELLYKIDEILYKKE